MADEADFAAENQARREAEFQQRLRESGAAGVTADSRSRETCIDCGVAIRQPNAGRCQDCQDDVDRLRVNRRL